MDQAKWSLFSPNTGFGWSGFTTSEQAEEIIWPIWAHYLNVDTLVLFRYSGEPLSHPETVKIFQRSMYGVYGLP